jgi:hypothetical protein
MKKTLMIGLISISVLVACSLAVSPIITFYFNAEYTPQDNGSGFLFFSNYLGTLDGTCIVLVEQSALEQWVLTSDQIEMDGSYDTVTFSGTCNETFYEFTDTGPISGSNVGLFCNISFYCPNLMKHDIPDLSKCEIGYTITETDGSSLHRDLSFVKMKNVKLTYVNLTEYGF